MKSKVLGSLVALGLVLVACGDSGTDTVGGGNTGGGSDGGGTDGGSPPIGGNPTIGGNSEGGGGGSQGDGNDTIATAEPLEENEGVSGIASDLDPAETDVDFFSFNGTAGSAVLITSDAKPDDDPFAEGFMDLVVTLFDADGNQIAQNDDPFPRTTQDAEFYTILPTTGQYFLKVEEFCEFAPANTCDPDYFDNLRSLEYAVNVITLDPATNSVMDEAAEPNDTVATATDMEYEVNPNATNPVGYYLSIAYGDWADAADVDAIEMNIPNDVYVDPDSRLNVSFVLPPPGSDGNGSSFNPGLVTVTNVATSAVVSRFDMSNEGADTTRAELNFPGVLGGQYLVTFGEGGAAVGGGDPFYFVVHSVGSGNPLETEEATNNLLVTPEALTQAQGVQSYFIEGDLGLADVDHFSVGVLDEGFTVTCSGQRGGSGLQGFKATVLQGSNGQPVAGASASTESATDDLLIEDLPVPATETLLVVKLEKSGQDATNTGTYYRCGLHFNVLP